MRRAVADHMGRNGHARNNPAGQGIKREVANIVWIEEMSASLKVLGAAGAGAFAKWLFAGIFTWKSFAQMLGTVAIGGAAAVAVLWFIPALREAPEGVQWAIAGIVGSSAGTMLERIETFRATVKIGHVELETEGTDEKDKLP